MSNSTPASGSRFASVLAACTNHYVALAAAVLCLTALNLTLRLGHEIVTEWDESLYARSAAEMVESGRWIGSTIDGHLDYYNTKPPLNIWLIALSFKAFGKGLLALRLTSVVSAWLTVLVLMTWSRRVVGPAVALFAGVVLATNFGFVHVHGGRSADTDALLTLLTLLTVVTLWTAQARPWRLVWLGPLLAAVFLLKGMAVLMPVSMVLAVEGGKCRANPSRWGHMGLALALFALPVGAWAAARWSVDEWEFLRRVVYDDFVGHSLTVLEGHVGGPLFYLNLLQKHQYDWLLAACAALLLFPIPRSRWRDLLTPHRDRGGFLFCAWAAITLLVPTLMQTKQPWYLNPFYPAFAVGTAWVLVQAMSEPRRTRRRRAILGLVVAMAFGVAEGKLVWYSFHKRDLGDSVQGMLIAARTQIEGHVVFASSWDNAGSFVLGNLVQAGRGIAADPDEFLRRSASGDYLLWSGNAPRRELDLVRSSGGYSLYRRNRMIATAPLVTPPPPARLP